MVLPICVLGYVAYGIAARVVQEEVTEVYLSSLRIARSRIDNRLRSIKNGLYQISENATVYALQRAGERIEGIELFDVLDLADALLRLKSSDPYILDAFVYFANADSIVDSQIRYDVDAFFSRRLIFAEHSKRETFSFLKATSSMSYVDTGTILSWDGAQRKISSLKDRSQTIVRSIPVGVSPPVVIFSSVLDVDALGDSLCTQTPTGGLGTYLFDASGSVIATGRPKDGIAERSVEATFALATDTAEDAGVFSTRIDGRAVEVLFSRLEEAPWTLLALVEKSTIAAKASAIRRTAIQFAGVALLVGAIIAVFATKRLYRPVNRILASIEEHASESRSKSRARVDELAVIGAEVLALDAATARYKAYLERYRPMVRERVLYHLARGNYGSRARILAQLQEVGVTIANETICAGVLEIDDYERVVNSDEHVQTQLVFAMIADHAVRTLKQLVRDVYVFYDEHRVGAFIAGVSTDARSHRSKLMRSFEEAQEAVSSELGFTVSVGIGPVVTAIEQFPDSYDMAQSALAMRFFRGFGRVIFYSDFQRLDGRPRPIDLALKERIASDVHAGRVNELAEYVLRLGKEHANAVKSPEAIRAYYREVVWTVVGTIESLEALPDGVIASLREHVGSIETAPTLSELERRVSQCFRRVATQLDSQSAALDSRIRDVRRYLEDHYDDQLTLTTVAEYFEMSPAYLSSLYKRVTGANFLDSLTAIRVQKAKDKILAESSAKIEAIARETGFGSYKSFSRAFKARVGLSPSDFRRAAG